MQYKTAELLILSDVGSFSYILHIIGMKIIAPKEKERFPKLSMSTRNP
jgi:hypothetical protein